VSLGDWETEEDSTPFKQVRKDRKTPTAVPVQLPPVVKLPKPPKRNNTVIGKSSNTAKRLDKDRTPARVEVAQSIPSSVCGSSSSTFQPLVPGIPWSVPLTIHKKDGTPSHVVTTYEQDATPKARIEKVAIGTDLTPVRKVKKDRWNPTGAPLHPLVTEKDWLLTRGQAIQSNSSSVCGSSSSSSFRPLVPGITWTVPLTIHEEDGTPSHVVTSYEQDATPKANTTPARQVKKDRWNPTGAPLHPLVIGEDWLLMRGLSNMQAGF